VRCPSGVLFTPKKLYRLNSATADFFSSRFFFLANPKKVQSFKRVYACGDEAPEVNAGEAACF
jgi:hypothetical protein